MRHQLARGVTRHDHRPLVVHFRGLTRVFGWSRRTLITGANQKCVLGGRREEVVYAAEEALEDEFARLLRIEPTTDDLNELVINH